MSRIFMLCMLNLSIAVPNVLATRKELSVPDAVVFVTNRII